jgi:hypothetical protein
MPVHQFIAEKSLVARGLTNYWGYNTIGFLAPHNRYSSAGQRGEQVGEFKTMVKALHEAGIEVILDVVYNHTAEGDHMGPTLSFRGIDNAAYYRLDDASRGATWTTPAAATASTRVTRTRCSWSWTRCGTGSSRCTSTGSGSTWPRRWPGNCTTWTGCPPSSTWSSRTPSSRRSS